MQPTMKFMFEVADNDKELHGYTISHSADVYYSGSHNGMTGTRFLAIDLRILKGGRFIFAEGLSCHVDEDKVARTAIKMIDEALKSIMQDEERLLKSL
jgi:hypothetical protein